MQVTTPDDMLVAEGFLMSKGVEDTLEANQSDLSEASVVLISIDERIALHIAISC